MGMCWPQTLREIEIKSEAENTFRRIKKCELLNINEEDDVKDKLRSIVRSLLKKKQTIPRKVRQMMKALKELSKEKTIYISRPDKGNGVVILDRSTYVEKMNALLDSDKFKEVKGKNKNIFEAKEDQTNRKLLQLKKDGKLDDDVYEELRSRGCQPSRLYGLPKIHKDKEDPPLRPILSMTNSYCENIAKWLLSILSPYLPSKFSVRDSFTAQQKIIAADLSDTYIVSFDAIQLFTNIPVQETIKHITESIRSTDITITKDTLSTLLNMSCTNVPFRFNGQTLHPNFWIKHGFMPSSSYG